MIFALTIVALFYAGPVSSAIVNVNFSGIIWNVNDFGGLPDSNTITVGESTFSGQFSYDTDTSGTLQDGAMHYDPTGAFTVTIDMSYTFQAPSSKIVVLNSDFVDKVEVYDNDNAVSIPGYSDSYREYIYLHLESYDDPLSSQYLTSSIFSYDDWEGASKYVQIIGRNSSGVHEWDLVGTIYEMRTVPIPGAVCLLGSGLLGLIGFRRKFKK
jgi:hypothetical protein